MVLLVNSIIFVGLALFLSFLIFVFDMLIKFIFASFLLSLLPGPDIFFVMTQSVTRGSKAAFSVTLGLCSGLFVHTAAVALGLAALMAASPLCMTLVKIFGGLYLFWLGVCVLRAYKNEKDTNPDIKTPLGGGYFALYKQGLIMNILNPKVILFFLSFLPAFVPTDISVPYGVYIIFLGLCFALVALSVFGAVSLFGGYLNGVLRLERRTKSKTFAWISALIYWLIAVWILSA